MACLLKCSSLSSFRLCTAKELTQSLCGFRVVPSRISSFNRRERDDVQIITFQFNNNVYTAVFCVGELKHRSAVMLASFKVSRDKSTLKDMLRCDKNRQSISHEALESSRHESQNREWQSNSSDELSMRSMCWLEPWRWLRNAMSTSSLLTRVLIWFLSLSLALACRQIVA